MESKKNRTLELYMEAGAWMRILKTVLCKTEIALSKVMPYSKLCSIKTFDDKLRKLSSDCEDRMFFEHDIKGIEFSHIFYGATNISARSEIDEEQIEKIKMFAEGLFEK